MLEGSHKAHTPWPLASLPRDRAGGRGQERLQGRWAGSGAPVFLRQALAPGSFHQQSLVFAGKLIQGFSISALYSVLPTLKPPGKLLKRC